MLWSVVNERYYLRNFPRTELSLNAVILNRKKVYKKYTFFHWNIETLFQNLFTKWNEASTLTHWLVKDEVIWMRRRNWFQNQIQCKCHRVVCICIEKGWKWENQKPWFLKEDWSKGPDWIRKWANISLKAIPCLSLWCWCACNSDRFYLVHLTFTWHLIIHAGNGADITCVFCGWFMGLYL